jgi:hypothetical protein
LNALSIDLAYTRHSDIGVALLHPDAHGQLHARCMPVPLAGTPHVERLADWIDATALAHDARCLSVDGPLAWQGDDTPALHGARHSRLCERLVNAPGKTGRPHHAKPVPYLPFTEFSIALGRQLLERGWTLANESHTNGSHTDGSHADGSSANESQAAHAVAVRDASRSLRTERVLMESFPTAAWRALGLPPLPGKSRVGRDHVTLDAAKQVLRDRLGLSLSDVVTHDDIQAVVGGIAGAWWTGTHPERVRFVGAPPFRALDGTWREGYIILPVSPSSVPA